MSIVIRPAVASDIDAIRCIYAHHVQHGTGSFETEPPDHAEMARRWSEVEARGLPWLAVEKLALWNRLRIAVGRIAETDDDELAYAYYAANERTAPYDRRRYSKAYARRAYAVYRPHHIERGRRTGIRWKTPSMCARTFSVGGWASC